MPHRRPSIIQLTPEAATVTKVERMIDLAPHLGVSPEALAFLSHRLAVHGREREGMGRSPRREELDALIRGDLEGALRGVQADGECGRRDAEGVSVGLFFRVAGAPDREAYRCIVRRLSPSRRAAPGRCLLAFERGAKDALDGRLQRVVELHFDDVRVAGCRILRRRRSGSGRLNCLR